MAIIDNLRKISDTIWELPPSYKAGMRVPARVITTEKPVREMVFVRRGSTALTITSSLALRTAKQLLAAMDEALVSAEDAVLAWLEFLVVVSP